MLRFTGSYTDRCSSATDGVVSPAEACADSKCTISNLEVTLATIPSTTSLHSVSHATAAFTMRRLLLPKRLPNAASTQCRGSSLAAAHRHGPALQVPTMPQSGNHSQGLLEPFLVPSKAARLHAYAADNLCETPLAPLSSWSVQGG